MSGFGRKSTGIHPATGAMVHEARAFVIAVDQALRDRALAGPADAYHVMGSLSLLTRTLQHSLSE
ncbi:MAG: hypothetical protein ABJA81_07165, partial [Nocardioidaceae bacterium]